MTTGFRTMPIWRDARRLLTEMEQAVRRFPLYQAFANDLRRHAATNVRLWVNRCALVRVWTAAAPWAFPAGPAKRSG